MRLTYFDDAGLFNAQQEPFIVIGGIIVNGDEQLIPLENAIDALVRKHIPEKDWNGFVFHATELWSGGRYFARDAWPLEKRLEILGDLAAIPGQLETPVSLGYQDREVALRLLGAERRGLRETELSLYLDCYARFCETVEHFMREVADDEVTLLIGEDNDAIRSMVKAAHQSFRDAKWVDSTNPLLTYFPFEKIREGVHFSPKPESKALQIADVCTFVIKRRLMNDPHVTAFYDLLKPWMIVHPESGSLA